MESVAERTSGFGLCDSSAVRAIAVRRIGSLPFSMALGCADIGEAKLADGRRVLITLGRALNQTDQFWFAHQSSFSPVWVGAEDGACELVIGETFGNSSREEWIWNGLRIVSEDGPEWTMVDSTNGGE